MANALLVAASTGMVCGGSSAIMLAGAHKSCAKVSEDFEARRWSRRKGVGVRRDPGG